MNVATTALTPPPAYKGHGVVILDTLPDQRRGSAVSYSGLRPSVAVASAIFMFANATTTEAAGPQSVTIIPAPTSDYTAPHLTAHHISSSKVDVKEQLIKKVREIGALQLGWHNVDSCPATQRAVDDAERFIRRFDWNMVERPIVSLTDDGEINLVWSDDHRHLDIGFFGDGTYAFYGKDQAGESYLEDGATIGQPLPERVIALIAVTPAG